ncbi:hypothetical protein N0V93_001405 [Gnomoniopsis smithogilvyi]|uniref:Carrier domain-containing protein n=1 Tax=Gnomoniopsis smithogilvyi TaxID=1191159 RepID=A0A9W8Z1J9_9PEZI|nr:hypothetical protein N0V93_001405 [Gnomoniopsis smithogilvyi]
MTDLDFINNAATLAQICKICQLQPQDIQDVYQCTPLQWGLMVDSALYVGEVIHDIDPCVDLDRLCGALEEVVARNDVLRTRIVDSDDDGLLQVVVKKGPSVIRSAETDFVRFMEWNNSLVMGFGTPLVRMTIVRDDGGTTRLVTTMHHAIYDFHVAEFLMADTWSIYQGSQPPAYMPFKDFAGYSNSMDVKEAAAFWKNRFRGGAAIFPPIPHGHRALASETITQEISFLDANKEAKARPSMALMPAYMEAAWAMTASDYTSTDSIAYGFSVSGRIPGVNGAAETTFGPTVTTIPVQVDLGRNMTIKQLVMGRAASRREMTTSRYLQYGLKRIAHINGDTQQAARFQSVLNILHRPPTEGLVTSGLYLNLEYTREPPRPYGLLLICAPSDKNVLIKALFDPVVFAREQVQRVLRQLEHRLKQLVTFPPTTPLKRLPCLNFGDTLELMDWNDRGFPKSAPGDACLHSRIAARAAEQPDALAVTSWDGEATYAELMTMVGNLAHEIVVARNGSINADEPICVRLGRSLSLTVAIMAVMTAGGAVVPIDPNLPEARQEVFVRRCGAQLILTSPDSPPPTYGSSFLTHAVVLNRTSDATTLRAAELSANFSSSRAAYILFTSGSTGQPKGVVLEHRSLASSFTAWAETFNWTTETRILHNSAPAWDVCALENIGSLLAGACICIPSDQDRESGLGEYIRTAGVEFTMLTPTAQRNLTPEDVVPTLKTLVSCGEPITREIFEKWSDKLCLFNAWGPCECSVVASAGRLTPDARYPNTIGTAVGSALWVVDPEDVNRLLPIGAVGEILVEGPSVGREYLLAPEVTKASFIQRPSFAPRRQSGLESPRLYRTGDLGRYLADGSLECLGRRDTQVKVRGQRFELGEVESVLARHPAVSQIAAFVYHTDTGPAPKELISILTLSSHDGHDDNATSIKPDLARIPVDEESRQQLEVIRNFAENHLATFMVPTLWIIVEKLPQTPSKKVDRPKITAWLDTVDMSAVRGETAPIAQKATSSQAPTGPGPTLTAPTTPAEEALQSAWSLVLRIPLENIGRESSFMRMGGDSITAMQVATRCRKQGFQIAVVDLLQKLTLADSARQVKIAEKKRSRITSKMNAADESHHRPLSAIQSFFVEHGGPAARNHFNQAIILDLDPSVAAAAAAAATPENIKKALGKLVAHHAMLRCRFSHAKNASGHATLTQWIAPQQQHLQVEGDSTWGFRVHENVDFQVDVRDIESKSQASIDIIQGPVFAADVMVSPQGQTSVLLVAHHLVIDQVSWRILIEDLETALQDYTGACVLPSSVSYPIWAQSQRDMLKNTRASPLSSSLWPKADRHFWKMDDRKLKTRDSVRIQHSLDQDQTAQIIGPSCNLPFNTTPVVLLLAAVTLSFRRVFPDRGMPALYCEGHGRDTGTAAQSMDTSRTIGWFTTIFPLDLHDDLRADAGLSEAVMVVKDGYQGASKSAEEQFVSQALGERTSSFKRNDMELVFNFTGRLQQAARGTALLRLRTDGAPAHLDNVTGEAEQIGLMSLYATIGEDERLTLTLDYDCHMAHQDRIVRWMTEELENCFREMTCSLPGSQCRLTASDLPLLRLGPGGPASLVHLHSQLEGLGIAQDNVESIYPCTATQEGILLAQLKGHDYHDRFVSRLSTSEGQVSAERIADAWKAVCQAHPILRTLFTSGLSDQGAFQQIVLKSFVPSISVEHMPVDSNTISQVIASQEKPPLDDQKAPPHHLAFYRESASVVYAVLDISHAIFDASTYQALWKNIAREYSRAAGSDCDSTNIAPCRPFSDYVVWLQTQQDEARQHWKNYLEGVKPCVFPRSPTAAFDYVDQGPFIPVHQAVRLNQFCQEQGVTVATFLQAAWALVLQQHTGNSTVCFGSLRSDHELLPGADGAAEVLGPLISMLPCKISLEHPETLTALHVLEAAGKDAADALQRSGCYLAELHDDLDLGESRLFDTVMTIQRAWAADLGGEGGNLVVEMTEARDSTEYSIVAGVRYSESEILIQLAYQRAHVSDALLERIAATFARAIEYMLDTPRQPLAQFFEPLSPTLDSLGLLKQWNAECPATAAEASVLSSFRAVAQAQGLAPAVCSWDRDLSYAELDCLSDRLAYKLRVEHGVRSDTTVAFCCAKAASVVVIMLAIWKAGAGFLALDFSHPPDRLEAILREAEAKVVLVNTMDRAEKMTSCFPSGVVDLVDLAALEQAHEAHEPDDAVVQEELSCFTIQPEHAAVVVYTSGSTGRPKGIVLHHGAVVTTATHIPPVMGLTAQSRILQLSNLIFDFGLFDVILSWSCGACICMPSDAEATGDVGGAIRRMGATYVLCTPTYATLFSPEDAPSLRTLVLGGEVIKQENLETWASHARVMNVYGPAETSLISSCADVAVGEGGAPLHNIGRPTGCRFWVVNPKNHDELVPAGTSGELVIEGPNVGRGYINDVQTTANAFIDAPAWTRHPELESLGLGEHRFYKTGDLVTQSAADSFVWDSRKDAQVKIRGQRIETSEIEHHLTQETTGASKWVVEAVTGRDSQETYLAAFWQVSSQGEPEGSQVAAPEPQTAKAARQALGRKVPSYMVPEVFLPIRKFPTHGPMKTDRKALRAIASSLSPVDLASYRLDGRQQGGGDSAAVLTGRALLLQQAWADLLHVPAKSIRPEDNFFVLGGNSIRAMRLVAALRKSGYLLAVVDIFKSPILAEMALQTRLLPGHRNGLAPEPAAVIQPCDVPRLEVLAKTWPWLDPSNIESVAPATDMQAFMLSEGFPDGICVAASISIAPLPGRQDQSLSLVRLRKACEKVISRHGILRTVFVQNEQSLLQVTLRTPPVEQIHEVQADETSGRHRVSVSPDMLDILPHFSLTSDESGSRCLSLHLTIHHAHYDAISLGHLLNDLSNAYSGAEILMRQPSFHEWSCHVANASKAAESQGFWRDLLKGSMSYPLAASSIAGQRRPASAAPQHRLASIEVPLNNLRTPSGTPAVVLNAAWSCVLSQVLGKQDVVFSFLTANRFAGTFDHGSVEEVAGPCINLVPVRALLGDGTKSMATLVRELQEQSNETMPHQHVGFRSIVKNCTQWPTSRFNSALLFQNHEAFGGCIRLGDTDCEVVAAREGEDSADVWITAVPHADRLLSIELRFSQANVPAELCQWTAFYLERLLNTISGSWEKSIQDIHEEVLRVVGPNPSPPIPGESGAVRPRGTDPDDVVDKMLQTKYLQYL